MKRIYYLLFVTAALLGTANAQEPFVGEIIMVGYTFCPRGYTEAAGQLLAISSNNALFSLYGTTYGGDGRTTFALPDLRGRAPIGQGNGAGLSDYRLGQRGGVETVTLTQNELPSHTHSATTNVTVTLKADPNSGDSDDPTGAVPAKERRSDIYSGDTPSVDMSSDAATANATTTVGNAGGNLAHENRMPYLTMRYCVALVGIYPSRN